MAYSTTVTAQSNISTTVQPAAGGAAITVQAPAHAITLVQQAAVVGGGGGGGDYLLTANRFSEYAGNPTAQAAARQNLELQNIDGGTFA